METTVNNTIITLTNKEVKEAILNYAFKKKPSTRPLGTKEDKYPRIFININYVGPACFIDTTNISENSVAAIIAVSQSEEVCEDAKK